MERVEYEKGILTKAFCDDVYTELTGMEMNILAMKDELGLTYGEESEPFKTYQRHLVELADQIEWKLQILSHACPHDWKGSEEEEYTENTASVGPVEKDDDFSPGYLGG